jgi:alkylation response protein AidB-like acyl-CoA dehydrogenase
MRDNLRRFLERQYSREIRRERLETEEIFEISEWRAGADFGFTSMLIPEDYGGGSLTTQPVVDLIVVAEELGRVLHPGPFVETNIIADAIVRSGSSNLTEMYLTKIAQGEIAGAWCVSGDGTFDAIGSGIHARQTKVGYVVDGHASFVHNANMANLFLVHARTRDGIVTVLVPAPTEGLSVSKSRSLDLTRRYGTVHFDDVAVELPYILQVEKESSAPSIAHTTDLANVLKAGEILGASDAIFEMTLEYLKTRKQFGRPIGSFQAIKHRMANLHIAMEGMRAATHYAALAFDDDFIDVSLAVSTAASFNSDSFAKLTGECLQLHGGIGFAWEYDVHLYLRRAKVDEMIYGTPSWHRERLWAMMCDQLTAIVEG